MGKTTAILDGCSLMDKATDEGGYNYYGYVRTGTSGEWVIMRENSGKTQYRYAIGGTAYSTAWTNRSSQSYTIRTNV